MDLLKELLELSQPEQGDPEMDQAIADIQRRYGQDPERARAEIDKWKRARLQRVDPKTRALLLQKERMTQQLDAQLARQRATQAPETPSA